MPWEIPFALTLTILLLAFSPGPAVLLTVSHGMRSGWGDSIKVALGVQAGNGVYFVLSALGLGALLQASETLFHAVKWIGAAYLVFLGVRTWRNARRNAHVGPGSAAAAGSRPFVQGVLCQLANPKAVLFFGALMPQFVDPVAPQLAQYVVFATLCFVAEMPVLAGYGWLAAKGGRLSRSERVALWRERVSGGLLVGVGASLAAIRRAAWVQPCRSNFGGDGLAAGAAPTNGGFAPAVASPAPARARPASRQVRLHSKPSIGSSLPISTLSRRPKPASGSRVSTTALPPFSVCQRSAAPGRSSASTTR